MKACAIICEFNPIHNGHLYLINKAREEGATHIAAIMSGNFVQRGDIALADKFIRTKQALMCGADIVIELPVTKAISGAEDFAFGGVCLADSLSSIEHLYFGCEAENGSELISLAEFMLSGEYASLVSKYMTEGVSYASAAQQAAESYRCGFGKLLASSNNILAVEYIKALRKLNSSVKPAAVVRASVNHDSEVPKGSFACASYLRNQIKLGNDDIYKYMPAGAAELLQKEISEGNAPVFNDSLEKMLLYKLRSMSLKEFSQLPYISEGLENRIFKAVSSCSTITELLSAAKTKRYTMARLKRILLFALLNIDRSLQQKAPAYIRVLGMNKNGAELLKSASLPVITKINSQYDKLSASAKKILDTDIFASDIYALCKPVPKPCGNDYTIKITPSL